MRLTVIAESSRADKQALDACDNNAFLWAKLLGGLFADVAAALSLTPIKECIMEALVLLLIVAMFGSMAGLVYCIWTDEAFKRKDGDK